MKLTTLFPALFSLLIFAQCAKDYTDGEVSDTDAYPLVKSAQFAQNGFSPQNIHYQYDLIKRAKGWENENNAQSTYEYDGDIIRYQIAQLPPSTDTTWYEYHLENGLMTEYSFWATNSSFTHRYELVRNAQDLIITQRYYRDDVLTEVSEHEYDGDGNRTQTIETDATGAVTSRISYSHYTYINNSLASINYGRRFADPANAAPNPVKTAIFYNAQGQESKREENNYALDSKGLIIQRNLTRITPNQPDQNFTYTYSYTD